MRLNKKKIIDGLKRIGSIIVKKINAFFDFILSPDMDRLNNALVSGKYDILLSIAFMFLLIFIACKFHKEIGVFAISMALFIALAFPFFCISLLRRFDKDYDKNFNEEEED